jgi:phenylalanyl-tRNA synthetase beta chain
VRDALDASGLVETLAIATGAPLRLMQAAEPGFHPGRAARVLLGERVLGVVGEVHPEVAAAWNLPGRVVAGELSLTAWEETAPLAFVVPSALPPVVFDLAFDLPAAVPVADLVAAIRRGGGPHLEGLVVFDVFAGTPLAPGRKSVALRLTFRHPERTMMDEEMVPIRAAITAEVGSAVGGILRGG